MDAYSEDELEEIFEESWEELRKFHAKDIVPSLNAKHKKEKSRPYSWDNFDEED